MNESLVVGYLLGKLLDYFDEELARVQREQAHEQVAVCGQRDQLQRQADDVLEHLGLLLRQQLGRVRLERLL